MAKKTTSKGVGTDNVTETDEVELPEGFEPVQSGVDGWFALRAGNSVQGTLIETFIVKGKFGPKKVFKVRISLGTTLVTTEEEDVFDTLTEGVVGVDQKGWLKALDTVGVGEEVFIRCLGKEDTAKKGQSPAWKFQVASKKAPF